MAERAFSDRPLGERDEMGLVGILSLHMLGQHFVERFESEVRAATKALENKPPDVFVDRRTVSVHGARA
jgi:hypothetical protein